MGEQSIRLTRGRDPLTSERGMIKIEVSQVTWETPEAHKEATDADA